MEKDMTLVRIYLLEGDHGSRNGLLEEIISILHDEQGVHGMTVYRGIAGFAHGGDIHSANLLRVKTHLPVVVEFFDEAGIAAAAVEALADLVPPDRLVKWTVRCHSD
jgi:PII-like signaling protein